MQVFSSRDKTVAGTEEKFVGTAFLDYLKKPSDTMPLQIGHARFAPCARTNWHTHPFGQTLIIVDGIGWVCSRGGKKIEVKAGDVIVTEPNEEHWHGASESNFMSHYAINGATPDGTTAFWNLPVTDEEYFA